MYKYPLVPRCHASLRIIRYSCCSGPVKWGSTVNAFSNTIIILLSPFNSIVLQFSDKWWFSINHMENQHRLESCAYNAHEHLHSKVYVVLQELTTGYTGVSVHHWSYMYMYMYS